MDNYNNINENKKYRRPYKRYYGGMKNVDKLCKKFPLP